MTNSPLILYDGVCNLCNYSVRFVRKRDANGIFQYASLQSDTGKKLLSDNNLEETSLSTFILAEDGRLFFKSTAALRVVKKLSGPVRLLYLLIIIPPFIRDFIYDIIARNRYTWFGKTDVC